MAISEFKVQLQPETEAVQTCLRINVIARKWLKFEENVSTQVNAHLFESFIS